MAAVVESIAVIGNYPGQVNLPSGIQEGDLLVALAYWGSEALEAIPGFTIIESAGEAWDWIVTQYRVADGTEVSPIVPDPDWVVYSTVVARISGVDASDPINVGGVADRVSGSGSTSKTVELDSISPDMTDCTLLTLVHGEYGSVADGITVNGEAIDVIDLQPIYAGGVNAEPLASSGATGTRTVVLSGSANVYAVMGAVVALNPGEAVESGANPLYLPIGHPAVWVNVRK